MSIMGQNVEGGSGPPYTGLRLSGSLMEQIDSQAALILLEFGDTEP